MKFMISGSHKHLDGEDKTQFKQACIELGKAMAEQGHTLLICSHLEDTVDSYVVNGATSIPDSQICFYRVSAGTLVSHPTADVFLYKQELVAKAVAATYVESDEGWDSVITDAIGDSDAVVVLGGGATGGVAVALKGAEVHSKPVILIPTFGGKAEETWQSFAALYTEEERKILREKYMQGNWGENIVKAAISIAQRAERP